MPGWRVVMRKMLPSVVALLLLIAARRVLPFAQAEAPSPTPALRLVVSAAEALGGRARILAIKTMRIDGYGQMAYQQGGGNITASPDAPQKWTNINGSHRVIDVANGRMSLQQRQFQDFVFAYERNMTGRGPVATQVVDGDIAFNVGADGRAVRASDAVARERRIEMLNTPIT